jgi:hypothetical protein
VISGESKEKGEINMWLEYDATNHCDKGVG